MHCEFSQSFTVVILTLTWMIPTWATARWGLWRCSFGSFQTNSSGRPFRSLWYAGWEGPDGRWRGCPIKTNKLKGKTEHLTRGTTLKAAVFFSIAWGLEYSDTHNNPRNSCTFSCGPVLIPLFQVRNTKISGKHLQICRDSKAATATWCIAS